MVKKNAAKQPTTKKSAQAKRAFVPSDDSSSSESEAPTKKIRFETDKELIRTLDNGFEHVIDEIERSIHEVSRSVETTAVQTIALQGQLSNIQKKIDDFTPGVIDATQSDAKLDELLKRVAHLETALKISADTMQQIASKSTRTAGKPKTGPHVGDTNVFVTSNRNGQLFVGTVTELSKGLFTIQCANGTLVKGRSAGDPNGITAEFKSAAVKRSAGAGVAKAHTHVSEVGATSVEEALAMSASEAVDVEETARDSDDYGSTLD